MIIHTKFNENDEVYCMHNNKITKCIIKTICIVYPTYSLYSDSGVKLTNTQYFIYDAHYGRNSTSITKEENKLFKSKEELIKNL